MTLGRRHLLLGAAGAAALSQLPALAAGPPASSSSPANRASPSPSSRERPAARSTVFQPQAPLRGMTVSCPTYGPIWGSPLMRSAAEELKALGVRWVAIHPYARVHKSGEVGFTDAANTGFLPRCAAICDEVGLQLFYKPHLAYWGSFAWRGAITFNDERSWTRFFATYRRFIIDHAQFAEDHRLPLFCVGTELDATAHRPEWRGILEEVRATYRGPITYASNWDCVARVPFWDAVDAIGVQGYFPVGEGHASTAAIAAGWAPVLEQLGALSAQHGRQVLFTEIGYPRAAHAAKEPWKPDLDDASTTVALRQRLMDAALTLLPQQRWYAGAFWWKWMPGPAWGDRDFSMKDAEARAALKQRWVTG